MCLEGGGGTEKQIILFLSQQTNKQANKQTNKRIHTYWFFADAQHFLEVVGQLAEDRGGEVEPKRRELQGLLILLRQDSTPHGSGDAPIISDLDDLNMDS